MMTAKTLISPTNNTVPWVSSKATSISASIPRSSHGVLKKPANQPPIEFVGVRTGWARCSLTESSSRSWRPSNRQSQMSRYCARYFGRIWALCLRYIEHSSFIRKMAGSSLRGRLQVSVISAIFFTTLQIFMVGCKLGVTIERMVAEGNSGRIPVKAITTIFVMRLLVWLALSVSPFHQLAKQTRLLGDFSHALV
jgi:hypothetical protein